MYDIAISIFFHCKNDKNGMRNYFFIRAEDTQKIDIRKNARQSSGQSFDGCVDTRGFFPGSHRTNVEKILSMDKDMVVPVSAGISAIRDNLNCIGKLKRYFGHSSIPQVLEMDGLVG